MRTTTFPQIAVSLLIASSPAFSQELADANANGLQYPNQKRELTVPATGTWQISYRHWQDEVGPDQWQECLRLASRDEVGRTDEARLQWIEGMKEAIDTETKQVASEVELLETIAIDGDRYFWETTEGGGWETGKAGAGSYRMLGDSEKCFVRACFRSFDEDFFVSHAVPTLPGGLHFVSHWQGFENWRREIHAKGQKDPSRDLWSYTGHLGQLDGVSAPPWYELSVERAVHRVLDIPGRNRTETITLFDRDGGVTMALESEWHADGKPMRFERRTFLPYTTTVYDAEEVRVLSHDMVPELPLLETIASTPTVAERVIDRRRMNLSLPVSLLTQGEEAIDAAISERLIKKDPVEAEAEWAAAREAAAAEPVMAPISPDLGKAFADQAAAPAPAPANPSSRTLVFALIAAAAFVLGIALGRTRSEVRHA